MRLRDRIRSAVQTFRGAPDLQSRLTAAKYELEIANQTLELMGKEHDRLCDAIEASNSRLNTAECGLKLANQKLELAEEECDHLRGTIEENDSQLQFLCARADALFSALREFPPTLSSTEEMKRFYDAISYDLDPSGFTLYNAAKKLAGMEVTSLFPYEDARGMFEEASGHQLMDYLTAYCFDAVDWEIIPGSTYERAELGEVDTTTPEYQRFERQLYKSVLERMGFDEFLSPEELAEKLTAVQEQQTVPRESAMTMT